MEGRKEQEVGEEEGGRGEEGGPDCCGPRKGRKKWRKKRNGPTGPVRKRKKERREIRKKEGVEWGNKIGKNKLKINKNIGEVVL